MKLENFILILVELYNDLKGGYSVKGLIVEYQRLAEKAWIREHEV